MITLPNSLIELIISGKKKFEMRKCMPAYMVIGTDGFYVVEKGTDKVRCWCRVDQIEKVVNTTQVAFHYAPSLGVTPEYILKYAPKGTLVYMWKIGKVSEIENMSRSSFHLTTNPQSFIYCPWSYGEPFFNNL